MSGRASTTPRTRGIVKNNFWRVLSFSGLFFLCAYDGGCGAASSPETISNPPPPTSNPAPPAIIDETIPNGGVNLPFDFQFTVANGLQPFTWMETGALPPGVALSPQGELSGTPTGTGSFPITVKVQDSLDRSAAPLGVTIQIFPHGFQATGDMGEERAAHTATLLNNGNVLVAGGFNPGNLANAELFDPVTGAFTATGTMTAGRSSHTATLLAHGPAATNGKVLMAGGSTNINAELFDPATGTFTATGTMTELRSQHTSTLLNNGKVLLAGGTDDNTAELFDPATGTFALTGSMITGDITGHTATLLNDGRVLITGGFNFDDGTFASAELYDPATGSFTATGNMTQARSNHTAILLNNGNVLITGGFDAQAEAIATAELFEATTGTFSPVSAPASVHTFYGATLLNDGTVLVVGGFVFPNPPGDGTVITEVFDPTTNKFNPTGSLLSGRFYHTVTLLNNGQVLVTGGQHETNPTVYLKSAELYK